MSAGGAADDSPGRKPGDQSANSSSEPRRGDTNDEVVASAEFCRPLRGLCKSLIEWFPGLTPGATNLSPSSMAHCALLIEVKTVDGLKQVSKTDRKSVV